MKKPKYVEFSTNLIYIMTIKKITQKELAEKSGVEPSTICRIMSGDGLPGFETIKALKNALDVPYDILFNEKPTNPKE